MVEIRGEEIQGNKSYKCIGEIVSVGESYV